MGAKAITATPAHRPNPRELMPRVCVGSAGPQKGACRPLPAHLPSCTLLLLGAETTLVHALWGEDFGRRKARYARVLLGGRRDFLHAEAE